MEATFITVGDVRQEYNDDGTTKCFYVHRKDAKPICLHRVIDAYYSEGNHIYIDSYGNPWVKAPHYSSYRGIDDE